MNAVVLLMNAIMIDMQNTLAQAPSQEKNQIRSDLISSCLMKAGGSSGARPLQIDRANLVVCLLLERCRGGGG